MKQIFTAISSFALTMMNYNWIMFAFFQPLSFPFSLRFFSVNSSVKD